MKRRERAAVCSLAASTASAGESLSLAGHHLRGALYAAHGGLVLTGLPMCLRDKTAAGALSLTGGGASERRAAPAYSSTVPTAVRRAFRTNVPLEKTGLLTYAHTPRQSTHSAQIRSPRPLSGVFFR